MWGPLQKGIHTPYEKFDLWEGERREFNLRDPHGWRKRETKINRGGGLHFGTFSNMINEPHVHLSLSTQCCSAQEIYGQGSHFHLQWTSSATLGEIVATLQSCFMSIFRHIGPSFGLY